MTDGCWVQFWDDDGCKGATLRFDAADGLLEVGNLDSYTQSDGHKEGNEPDSLETGSRTWLIVYKDSAYGGKSVGFGPNSKVNDLDDYGMGGNISSFKLYDHRPAAFVDAGLGAPTAIESDGYVNAQTVNGFFRTVVGSAVNLIPGVGSALSVLVEGLWPDVDNKDQTWASYQNYLNQAVAGVYWQMTYETLNDALQSLYNAAKKFVDTPESDQSFKSDNFKILYNLVNTLEPFFVDDKVPEKRFSFLVPFATLRLLTLREHLQNFSYYYGNTPSEKTQESLKQDIRNSIDHYRALLELARNRILEQRAGMIVNTGNDLVDLYNGYRNITNQDHDVEMTYKESVENQLALVLDIHNAIGQLWEYCDPDVITPDPIPPPTLRYATGPFGMYQQWRYSDYEKFSQMAEEGQITRIEMWARPDMVAGFELYINGIGQGRIGGDGENHTALALVGSERIDQANGFVDSSGQYPFIKALGFSTNKGNTIQSGGYGDSTRGHTDIDVKPLDGSTNTRLIGLSGEDRRGDNLKVVTFHWDCELEFDPREVDAAQLAMIGMAPQGS